MKNFIASLKLRRSDLFLLIGFITFVPFLIFGQLFMQYPNPEEVAFPIWAIIPCFIVSAVMWGYYIYEEYKLGNMPHKYISYIAIFIAFIGVLGVLIQPSNFVENVVVRQPNPDIYYHYVGYLAVVSLKISMTHYVFFAIDILLIVAFIYIGLFIFPKRFTSIKFIKYLGYAVFLLVIALLVYSVIFEHDLFVPFIKTLLGKNGEDANIYDYALKSFIIHRNAYGMALMIGIVFAFINHSIENKWWYYLIAVLMFINMVFTYCKTGLLISALLIVIYVVYRLIVTYKEHRKRNKTLFIVFASLAILLIAVAGVSFLTKGKILSPIYGVINSIVGSGTLDTRAYIWDNSFQLLRNGWWIIGRGFGLYNEMLLPMNTVNGDPVFPAHSAYVGLLAEGGIFFLLTYIAFLGYSLYIIIRTYKKNPNLTIAISLGVLAFVLYSFIEAIQYLVYVFMFPIMILYHVSYLEENITTSDQPNN